MTAIKHIIIFFIGSLSLLSAQIDSGKIVSESSGSVKEGFDSMVYRNPLSIDVELELSSVTLEEVLDRISTVYGVTFVYESSLVDIEKNFDTIPKDNLENVLYQLLAGTDIGFVVIDDQVVLAERSSLQQRTGGIKGEVTNKQGEPLIGANVSVLKNNYGCATNKNGQYRIRNLKPGKYSVKFSYVGYESRTITVIVKSGRTTELNVELTSRSFNIGGIEVTAEDDFIPITPETKTKVSSGEIEHMQASSLNDVLELIPGVKTSNPTLNSVEKASIRGGDPIGTQIIMDGVPISNNTNMQVGVGYSTANSGVDLRSIPAENIEKVEVVRGIPSAQYGNLVDGIMIVQTKTSPSPLRYKMKYNPNVYEANVSGGVEYSNWVFNGNFNLASSGRDVRIEGDGYTRIAGQLNSVYQKEDFKLKNSFYVTRTFDEMKEQPGYALREAWYNKDLTIKYNGNFSYIYSSFEELNATFSVNYTKRNSYEQRLISRDNIVVSDRKTEGAQEGKFVFGTYLGKKRIKGNEWNIYSDVNYNVKFFTGSYLNSVIFGATFRNEFNNGEGIQFDPFYPPSLSIPSPRVRSYDALPVYNTLSFYFEDKLNGRLLRPFTLQVGARLESYRPEGINVSGLWGESDLIESNNGMFFNPRVNLSYNLFESTQLRLSYGVTSKSPPMGMIFAQDEYFDIVDTVSVKNPQQPDSNFSIISTYIKPKANEDLKGYKQYKYEASIDQQIGSVGFTLTGFLNNTEDMFSSDGIPTALYKKSYPNWPSTSGATPYDTLLDKYSRYTNDGYSDIKGLEFSFKTRRLPVINTSFKFDAAYSQRKSGSENGYYFGAKRYFDEIGLEVMPKYKSTERYSESLLLNYRFDIQTESLGMWITLHIQQQLLDIDGTNNLEDTLAIGYFTQKDEYVPIPEAERKDPKYDKLSQSIEPYELREEDRPNIWLFNLKVSKSLWNGAAISFFVNNFFNNRPLYKRKRSSDNYDIYERRNPPIFYGLEFQTSF